METLFIFIDESGNFDFSPKGTEYFSLSAISTLNPLGKEELDKIRYDLIKNGNNIEYFHASVNKQFVRNKVYEFIEKLEDIEIDSVIVQKNKTNPSLYIVEKKDKKEKGYKLYGRILQTLLQYILHRYENSEHIEQIIVILSSIFSEKKHALIKMTIKKYLKQKFSKPFFLYFHSCNSDKNTQIADYCGWAIYKKWTDGEMRPYSAIKNKIKNEFNMFRYGRIVYYNMT
jgi:hypothetical protein